MCVGLPKAAEHLLLAALYFVSFFWANKRKKIELRFKDWEYPRYELSYHKEKNKRIFNFCL